MSGTAWTDFSDALIQAQPTPVACALVELRSTQESLLGLWRACDLVELLLKMGTTMLFAELAQREDAQQVAVEALRRSQFKYWSPTLGMWRKLLAALVEQSNAHDSVLPELLSKANQERMNAFFDGGGARDAALPPYERSFNALRNRLAHGAGLTHDAATHLVGVWHVQIRAFVDAQLAWLGEFDFEARSDSSADPAYRVCGLSPMPRAEAAVPPECGQEEVWAVRGGKRLRLWPLLAFGTPRVPPRQVDVLAVQVYSSIGGNARKPTLFYTPYVYSPSGRPAQVVYWSQGDERGRDRLLEIFRQATELAAHAAKGSTSRGATAEFRDEARSEGKRMMGRARELRAVLRALEPRGGIFWLHGPAGIGKSMLMSKVAIKLLDAQEQQRKAQAGAPRGIVVLYRFRYADARCNSQTLLDLVLQTLHEGESAPAAAGTALEGQADRRAAALFAIETRLTQLSDAGRDVTFLFDGLDEIAAADHEFLPKVLVPLLRCRPQGVGRVTWLLAGRSELTAALLHAGATKLAFAEGDGMPGLEEKDVWAMLLDRIGGARVDLFKSSEDRRRDLDPIPATPALVRALARGEVPLEVLNAIKGADWAPDAAQEEPPRATERRAAAAVTGDGESEREWLIDDDDDTELYFATWRPGDARLKLRASRLTSPFIDALVERARDSDAAARGAKGKCLALYVKYVIDDILADQVGHTREGAFDPAWLPLGLTRYYDGMMKRLAIGGVASLLTDLVYLLAAAREALDAASIELLLADRLPRRATPAVRAAMVSDALAGLRSVLRERARASDGASTWTLYHHTLREYLLPELGRRPGEEQRDPYEQELVANAHARLADACADAATDGLAHRAALAGYAARHGIGHLLDDGDLASALALTQRLTQGEAGAELAAGALHVQIAQVAGALESAIGDPERASSLAGIDAEALRALIASSYETGLNVPAIHILIQHHSAGEGSAWERIGAELITPYDIVIRHDIGDAYAAIWASAAEADKARWMGEIEAMARDRQDDYRREIAGYALKHIYDRTPEQASDAMIRQFATGATITDRMVAGELLLTLAVKGRRMHEPDAQADFWRPRWAYLKCDVDALRVLHAGEDVPALAAQTQDPGLAACAREHLAIEALRARLREVPALGASPRVRRLLGDARQQFDAADLLGDPALLDDLATLLENTATRRSAIEFLCMLASHPLWNVAEEISTVLHRLVSARPHLADAIDEMLAEPSWRVRYCAIDATFNIGDFDDHERFRAALAANAMHPHCRVRGILADDLLGWLRLTAEPERAAILLRPGVSEALAAWLGAADDSWLLEYVYLIFRFLRGMPQAEALLTGARSPYLRGKRPFHHYEHGRFMRLIDRLRRRHIASGR